MEWKEGISIIIPVHNQARFLQNTVEQVELQMKNGKMKRFELIIAEDGSFDGSGAIAKKIAEKNPFVRVLSHKRKMGKGWAIKNALKFCKYEKIIFTDADLSGGTEVFLDMAKALETADLAIGNRYGKYRPKRAIARQILGLGYKLLVDILFLKQSYDYQCGLKGFKKSSIVKLLPYLKENGLAWDTELVLEADRRGLRIIQIPVEWVENKESSLNLISASFEMLFAIIAYRLRSLL